MITLEKIGGFLLAMLLSNIFSLLLMSLQVYIIYDVAAVYNLFFIVLIPVEWLYGLLFVIMFIRKMPHEDDKPVKTMGEQLEDSFIRNTTIAIVYCFAWFVTILFNLIIF